MPTMSTCLRAARPALICVVLVCCSLTVRAFAVNHPAAAEPEVRSSPHEAPASTAATIKKTIEARFPGISVLDVQPAPIPGLYEVYVGDRIVYADDHADYVIMGPMLDTEARKNLTEEHMNARATIDFRSLPLERAVKVVKGDGSRRFAVFSDPDCPYCQRLESSLLAVNNFTMYVFLYPIAALHPEATAKAHAIWCARDRARAWNQWMHEKKLPAAGASACSGDPIEELQKLGDRLHVNSTPTLFFTDGRRVAGAIPTSEIEKLLAAGATGAKSQSPAPAASQP